jgi:hypothetical protein
MFQLELLEIIISKNHIQKKDKQGGGNPTGRNRQPFLHGQQSQKSDGRQGQDYPASKRGDILQQHLETHKDPGGLDGHPGRGQLAAESGQGRGEDQARPGQDRQGLLVRFQCELPIPFGGFIRSLDYWAGPAMVVTLLLHMVRVFYYRDCRPPRSMNWLVGVGLLILILILDFAGYAWRWDADTYSATVVGTQIVKQIPWAGSALFHLLVGRAVWRNHGTPLLCASLFSPAGDFVRPDLLSFLAGSQGRDGGEAALTTPG